MFIEAVTPARNSREWKFSFDLLGGEYRKLIRKCFGNEFLGRNRSKGKRSRVLDAGRTFERWGGGRELKVEIQAVILANFYLFDTLRCNMDVFYGKENLYRVFVPPIIEMYFTRD